MKSYSTKNTRTYSNYTIRLLKDFGIDCTEEQKQTIRSLPTEEAVNRYKRELIKKGE